MSIHAATESVISHYGADGPSFEETFERFRGKFYKWKAADYPVDDLDYEAGDLGYRIAVTPSEGFSLETLTSTLPTKGHDQPATTWWRRLFRDGAVSIRYLGKK